jgi:hypothetical protein
MKGSQFPHVNLRTIERGLRETEDDNKGVFDLDGNRFDPKETGGAGLLGKDY